MARLQGSDLDFASTAKVLNLPNASGAGDAVPFGQLKALLEGNNWKDSVRVASTANVNTAAPGAAIDGVALAVSDRVLLKDQTAAAQNGIYIWNGAAVAMARADDASTFDELEAAVVRVEEGTVGAGTKWAQTQVNGVIGTNNVVWVSDSGSAPAASETTAGIAEIATQAEADTGTDDNRVITPAKMANWSGRKRKVSGTIGDGSASSFNIDHNFNMREVQVEVFRNSTPWDTINCDVSRPTVNRVTIAFAGVPTANQYSYVIIG